AARTRLEPGPPAASNRPPGTGSMRWSGWTRPRSPPETRRGRWRGPSAARSRDVSALEGATLGAHQPLEVVEQVTVSFADALDDAGEDGPSRLAVGAHETTEQ